MTQKQPKNPNIVRAKIVGMEYDYKSDLDTIIAMTHDAKRIVVDARLSGLDIDNKIRTITLWRGMDYQYKYLAFGDHIVQTAYQKNIFMDDATQQHFNEYKRAAEKRLALRARLDKIQQKVTLIRQIDTKSDAIATHAKQVLLNFLAERMTSLRQDLSKHR